MLTEVERSVKVIPFTEKSVRRLWLRKFLARGYKKGYHELLLGKEALPS
jgi:hypothetical protein